MNAGRTGPVRVAIAEAMASAVKLATMEDLPKLRNGVATPDSGTAPSCPPMMMIAGMASDSAQPSARKAA